MILTAMHTKLTIENRSTMDLTLFAIEVEDGVASIGTIHATNPVKTNAKQTTPTTTRNLPSISVESHCKTTLRFAFMQYEKYVSYTPYDCRFSSFKSPNSLEQKDKSGSRLRGGDSLVFRRSCVPTVNLSYNLSVKERLSAWDPDNVTRSLRSSI